MSSQADNVDKALADIAAGRFRSVRRAAFANAAPVSTVCARFHGRPKRANIDPSSQRLTTKQEQALVHWIMDLQRSYACPNYARFAEIVTEILRKNGDDIPLGKNWIQRFRE